MATVSATTNAQMAVRMDGIKPYVTGFATRGEGVHTRIDGIVASKQVGISVTRLSQVLVVLMATSTVNVTVFSTVTRTCTST